MVWTGTPKPARSKFQKIEFLLSTFSRFTIRLVSLSVLRFGIALSPGLDRSENSSSNRIRAASNRGTFETISSDAAEQLGSVRLGPGVSGRSRMTISGCRFLPGQPSAFAGATAPRSRRHFFLHTPTVVKGPHIVRMLAASGNIAGVAKVRSVHRPQLPRTGLAVPGVRPARAAADASMPKVP